MLITNDDIDYLDEEEYKKNLGKVISDRRLEMRMSQEHLAFTSGLSTPFISEIERGLKYPTLLSILKIAKVLETKPSQLLKQSEERGLK